MPLSEVLCSHVEIKQCGGAADVRWLAACLWQVLPTQLIPDDKEGKVLRVRFIQKEGVEFFKPTYLFDEGSTISWIPCGRKLTCSFPGIKFFYGPDTYYGEEVRFVMLQLHSNVVRDLSVAPPTDIQQLVCMGWVQKGATAGLAWLPS
jgi:hypothetical protein